MNAIALFLGYAVIGLITFVLIGLALGVLYGTITGFLRVLKYKRTPRLIKKYETKNMYKASKIAIDFLVSKGIEPYNTIGEAMNMIERYKKRNEIKEE